MTSEVFRICQGQRNNRSPLDVGFFILIIVEWVYIQVNGTQKYEHDNLNITTMVVLQVLFHYEIIYMKWAHQCQKSRLKSLSSVSCSLSSPRWG